MILILSLTLVLVVGITSGGTFGLFSDTETSAGNTICAWTEDDNPCENCGMFKVANFKGAIRKVFQYNYDGTNGSLIGSFDLYDGIDGDNGSPSGVATTGECGNEIYIIDQADKCIYKYDCEGNFLGISKGLLKSDNTSSIGNPESLAIHGNDIWTAAFGANEYVIYGYSITDIFSGTGTIAASIEILLHGDNTQPTGMAFSNDYLYVIDNVTERLYRYPYPGGIHTGEDIAISKELKDTIGNSLYSPEGVTIIDGALWLVDDSQAQQLDVLLRYDDIDSLFIDTDVAQNADAFFELDENNKGSTGV